MCIRDRGSTDKEKAKITERRLRELQARRDSLDPSYRESVKAYRRQYLRALTPESRHRVEVHIASMRPGDERTYDSLYFPDGSLRKAGGWREIGDDGELVVAAEAKVFAMISGGTSPATTPRERSRTKSRSRERSRPANADERLDEELRKLRSVGSRSPRRSPRTEGAADEDRDMLCALEDNYHSFKLERNILSEARRRLDAAQKIEQGNSALEKALAMNQRLHAQYVSDRDERALSLIHI